MTRLIQISLLICGLVMAQGCQFVQELNWLQSTPGDAQITSEVMRVLAEDPELTNINFHVETSERVVYISGYVKNIRESDEALRLVGQVNGVKRIENNIIVRK